MPETDIKPQVPTAPATVTANDEEQQQLPVASTDIVEKEPNNNENDNDNSSGLKQSVYDVLGVNDQELARRQYHEDDDDDDDDYQNKGDFCRRPNKRLALDNNVTPALKHQPDSASNKYGEAGEDSDGGDHDDGKARRVLNQDDNVTTGANDSNNGYHHNHHHLHHNQHQNELSYQSNNGGNHHATSLSDYERNQEQQYQYQPQHHQSISESEQMRKLFIGGLDYKTSEVTLKKHFEKFGDVIDCVVMREPQSKKSRGFGFVIYASSSMVDKAQEARPHEVDGREVQSKRAIAREDSGKPESQATVKKVYLGGLSDDIEESELRDYFKDFGNIVNVNIVVHKDTGKRRGFAFVEYDDYDPVDKIVLKKFHTIKDKRIEAKKAIPKVDMDARKRGDPRAAIAGAMMALSGGHLEPGVGGPPGGSGRGPGGRSGRGGNGACLWDGPYGPSGYPGAAAGYSSGHPPGLDGYYSHHHSPSAHYGAAANHWMMHNGGQGGGGGGSPYGGFRGAHGTSVYGGRNSYANQAAAAANWATAPDYAGGFPASQSGGGGGGPMRLSYQHRGWGPYGSGYGAGSGGSGGGAHRGRGYNP